MQEKQQKVKCVWEATGELACHRSLLPIGAPFGCLLASSAQIGHLDKMAGCMPKPWAKVKHVGPWASQKCSENMTMAPLLEGVGMPRTIFFPRITPVRQLTHLDFGSASHGS